MTAQKRKEKHTTLRSYEAKNVKKINAEDNRITSILGCKEIVFSDTILAFDCT